MDGGRTRDTEQESAADSPVQQTTDSTETALAEERRREEIRNVLTYQLDLEILHKWREVRVIEEEIGRGQQIQELVEKLVMNEFVFGGGDASAASSLRSTPVAEGSPGRRLARSVVHGKERPQTEPQPQYEVRPDGTVVRMRCPKCGADRFRSMLGFLNHCRIHCRLQFSSQDDRLQRCGVPIEPGEVPPDYFNKHPTQLKQEMDLALIRADVLGPVHDVAKKPTIHVAGLKNGVDSLPGSAGEPEGPPLKKASRYYVKRRIIVGNAAKSLTSGKGGGGGRTDDLDDGDAYGPQAGADGGGQQPTHKWRVYIKTPSKSGEDLRSFVRAVRFFLHPSYRPNDVVDVLAPPFELVRVGWGEFPIRIQIFFWDPRNKPVEIVHLIRVLTATTAKYVTVAEQAHDLDLDRKTDFGLGLLRPDTASSPLPPPEDRSKGDEVSDEDVLTMAVADFPLAGKRGKRAVAGRYKPIATMEEFLRLSLEEQKRQERIRAKVLCSHLMTTFPTFTMSVEDVVRWCREKGFTPASVATFTSALEQLDAGSSRALLFCRFCGLAHLPQDKFEILQKNCSIRPRKIHVSSRTPSQELFTARNYEMMPEASETFKRLKQECFGPSFVPFFSPAAAAAAVDSGVTIKADPAGDCGTERSDLEWRRMFVRARMQELHLAHGQANLPSTEATMERAMRRFLDTLLGHALAEIPESKERSAGRPVLLTPLHLYRAITTHAELDFLSNAHMLGSAQSKESPDTT